MSAKLINYDRYTELLGKRIHRTITPAEVADVAHFETAQPVINGSVLYFAQSRSAASATPCASPNYIGCDKACQRLAIALS
jgi:hypothetical protein